MCLQLLKACGVSLTLLTIFAAQQTSAQCILNNGVLVQTDGSPCSNTIITAVPFLRIVPDARFGAMGDAGIAVNPDPNSMHFNSSNLAFGEKDFSVSATYTPWLRALGLNDVFLAYLSGYKHIDDRQTLGSSLRYFSLGQIQYTDDQGNPLQLVRPRELEFAFSYARKMSKNFSTSLSLKYIFSTLGTGTIGNETLTPANAFAADISFTYRQPLKIADKNASLNFGLVFSNLGSKISYTKSANRDYIPANFGFGTAFNYDIDDHNSITIAVDVNKLMVPTPIPRTMLDENGDLVPNPDFDNEDGDGTGDGIPDYKQKSVPVSIFSSFGDAAGGFGEEMRELMYSIGVEYWYNKQFAVRFGHYNEHRTKGNRKFLTVGLGLKYNIFNINFSYLIPAVAAQRNPLDNTLRFSLIFDFGEAKQFDTKKKR
jgi:hypothetical protein